MKTKTQLKVTLLLFIVLTLWYSFYIISPPGVKPSSVSPKSFSAERALKHIQHIATQPRHLGTAANDSTRAYLIQQLSKMGLEINIQEGIGISKRYNVSGYVRNILAELPGTDPHKTILLMAHYDSVPSGPGAGDDASGVAVILEVLRALTSGNLPKHNIQVLFTDGEERGLLGAELFAEQYSEANPIDLVINMESRGSSGSSIMFESSSDNGALIPHFANATLYPVANSLTYTVYELMPNDTDLSATKRIGLAGLNYAIIDDFLNYHTQLDNIGNLSLESLQHHGENLLSNVLYFGNNTYSLNSEKNYVYFNNFVGGISYYPASWSFPLSVFVVVILVGYLTLLYRRKQIEPLKLILSALSFILLLMVGAALTYFGWQFIQWLHPQYQWLVQKETYNHEWYLIGFSALVLAITLIYTSWVSRKLHSNNLMAGIYIIWSLLNLVAAWYLPTASYLITWPVLFGLLGWIYLSSQIDVGLNWQRAAILCLSLFPALFIITPYIKLVHITMTTSLMAVNMILLLMLISINLPLLRAITEPYSFYWAGGLLSISLFCMTGAALNTNFDSEHKKQNNMMYFADLDNELAYWASRDHQPDAWTSQFLGNSSNKGRLNFPDAAFGFSELLYTETSLLPFEVTEIKIQSDSTDNIFRYLTLRIDNTEPGTGMLMKLADGQTFNKVSILGKNLNDSLGSDTSGLLSHFFYFADQTVPIDLQMIIPVEYSSPKLEITYLRHSLPTELPKDYKFRGDHMMPIPGDLADVTIWKKTFPLDNLSAKAH